MGVWATAEDVFDVTGREATPASLALAHILIELFSGATPEATETEQISARNARNLTRATAFQAVWLDSHPDAIDAIDVQGVSQDGLNATYATANAHLLAPLAQRLIDRLSWRRAGLRIGKSRAYILDRGNRLNAVRDDQYEWTPLPFGATPRAH